MSRPVPSRAIVLGSGGVLGFAWLLGALAALEAEAGFDAREAEVTVGTSAGSVASALLGCGLSVEVICRHHQGLPAPEDPPIVYDYGVGVGDATPPRPGWRPASPRLAWDGLRHPRQISPIVALSGLLPAGRGSLAPVRALVEGVARASGHAESWPQAPRPWIVAADHRSGRRVVFGRDNLAAGPDGRPREVRRARLADAVQASCSIPAWYPPTVIDGVPYVDGGAVSIASVDVLRHTAVDEVYVLAPMAAVEPDRPTAAAAKLERRLRRAVTRRIEADVARLRGTGKRVCLVTPGADDLTVMGVNMMNPGRRTSVFETARVTAAAQLRRELASSAGWGRRAGDGVAGDGVAGEGLAGDGVGA
jgi:NTE family protein